MQKVIQMNESEQNVLFHIAQVRSEIHELSYQINTLVKKVEDVERVIDADHLELTKLLMTRDFFWRIVVKIGLPLMFSMFAIGWALGKYAQHFNKIIGG